MLHKTPIKSLKKVCLQNKTVLSQNCLNFYAMRPKDHIVIIAHFEAGLIQPSIMNLVLHPESQTSPFYFSCAWGLRLHYFSLWVDGFLHTETLWGLEWKFIKPTIFSRENPQPQNMRGQNIATCTQYFSEENDMWAT